MAAGARPLPEYHSVAGSRDSVECVSLNDSKLLTGEAVEW